MQTFAGKRVLIVDDNPHARAILTEILSAAEAAVEQADGGPSALAALGRTRFDAVIADMFMQPMDGIALTRAIRGARDPAIARLPVIMASALASQTVVQGGAKAGVTAFLAKPFSPGAVLGRLARVFEEAPAAPLARPAVAI